MYYNKRVVNRSSRIINDWQGPDTLEVCPVENYDIYQNYIDELDPSVRFDNYYFVSPLLNYSNFFLFLYSINFVRHMNIYYITVIKFQNYHKNYSQKVIHLHIWIQHQRKNNKSSTVILLMLHGFLDDTIYSDMLKNHSHAKNVLKILLESCKVKLL